MNFLVDGNSVGWTVWHALPKRVKESEDKEFYRGVWVHSFLSKILSLVKVTSKDKRNNLLIVWDGRKGTEFRRKLLGGYKEKRKLEREKREREGNTEHLKFFECTAYFKLKMREVEGREKFTLEFEKLEADDLISAFCEFTNDITIVYSGDQDLLQVLENPNCIVFTPRNNEAWGYGIVKRKFGVKPRYLWIYKAVVGDPSDGWPGLKGVGEKTFKKIWKDKGVESVKEWRKDPKFVLGKKLCKLPNEELLEEVFGKGWEEKVIELWLDLSSKKVNTKQLKEVFGLRKLEIEDLNLLT